MRAVCFSPHRTLHDFFPNCKREKSTLTRRKFCSQPTLIKCVFDFASPLQLFVKRYFLMNSPVTYLKHSVVALNSMLVHRLARNATDGIAKTILGFWKRWTSCTTCFNDRQSVWCNNSSFGKKERAKTAKRSPPSFIFFWTRTTTGQSSLHRRMKAEHCHPLQTWPLTYEQLHNPSESDCCYGRFLFLLGNINISAQVMKKSSWWAQWRQKKIHSAWCHRVSDVSPLGSLPINRCVFSHLSQLQFGTHVGMHCECAAQNLRNLCLFCDFVGARWFK